MFRVILVVKAGLCKGSSLKGQGMKTDEYRHKTQTFLSSKLESN